MEALSGEGLFALVYEAAGAATAPLLQDHPDYVFPDQRVSEAVDGVLIRHGFTERPVGYSANTGVPVPRLATAADAEALREKILDALDSHVSPAPVDRDDFDEVLVDLLGLTA